MYPKAGPHNTFSTFPARTFRFVLDPALLPSFIQREGLKVLILIEDLRALEAPLDIRLVVPQFLSDTMDPRPSERLKDTALWIAQGNELPPFKLSLDIPKRERDSIEGSNYKDRMLALLSLAEAVQADAIITDQKELVGARFALRHYQELRIVPFGELADLVEICAHGHQVFWSVDKADRDQVVDTYYVTVHRDCSKRAMRVLEFMSKEKDDSLKNEVRSAMLNRYPFILYARDQIRFFELQFDHFSRRGLKRRFVFPVGYHITTFYLLLWGMLEQLTLIAKYKLGLKLGDRVCGILNRQFWEEADKADAGLRSLVEDNGKKEWVGHMADMRHEAAHKTLPLPAAVFEETEESKKGEDYIRAALRKEKPFMYSYMPKAYLDLIEPQMIQQWRERHMKPLMTKHVLISRPGKNIYFRDPMNSIDADIGMLMSIVDPVLERLCSIVRD